MSTQPNGGPAFPFTPHPQQQLNDGRWDQSYDPGDSGMSLRDYFAAPAPEPQQWWLEIERSKDRNANPYGYQDLPKPRGPIELDAAWRYMWADAMLAAREKGAAQ
jgi:hypothetical protein